MKKIIALLLAVLMVVGLFAGCGQKPVEAPAVDAPAVDAPSADQGSGTKPAESTYVPGSYISVCLASEPDTLDPALNSSVDGATMCVQLFAGLSKWTQNEDGQLVIVADCAEELVEGVANEDGTTTYTYTLKEGLVWSDGQPVTAHDFEFAWKRAASVELAADYGYMFDVIDGYNDVWAEPAVEGAELNVHALDERTLEVVLANNVAYWNELLAFPTYYPVREDVVADEAWATDPSTYVCNGAYTITDWQHNSVITLTRNENYHDADSVAMETIDCFLSDDDNNMLTNFKNGDWLFIDSMPLAEIPALKVDYADEFVIAPQIGTYYVCWNVNEEILPADSTLTGAEAEAAKAEIRSAIGLLLDRNYICEYVSQAGELPASSFVAAGMVNPDGTQFHETAGGNDFAGYYDVSVEAFEANFTSAVETLKKYYAYDETTGMFTNFPTLTYLYNTADNHKAIGEYIQAALSVVGINMTLENQEWATFLNTRKDGNFSVARNGWVADYTDPICFLDMWITVSGNNDIQFGKGAHADLACYDLDLTPYGIDYVVEDGTWAETYDVLISEIKACTDPETRYAMMHLAEDILMSTGCIVPVYYYTDPYMISSDVEGFFSTPLGYKYFMYTTVNG